MAQITYLRHMYLYNVTVIVEHDVQEVLMQRIRARLNNRQGGEGTLSILEMLDSPHEGTTYCIQLRSPTMKAITAFQRDDLAAIQSLADNGYPGKALFFDSVMKYLND